MPELPEVETIKNEITPHVVGQFLIGIVVYDDKLLGGMPVEKFCGELLGKKIVKIGRRGKYLIFTISGGHVLVLHLRMTGSLLLNTDENTPYVRAVLQFGNGEQIAFVDRRRLGMMYLLDTETKIIEKLGVEPLTEDFTVDVLANKCHGRKAPIKAVLLDQNFIAGIGNMYADEAIFAARIYPLKSAGDLSMLEIKKLYKAIVGILKSAVINKGASVDTFKRPGGRDGTAHYEFNVAHRRGEKCRVCGNEINRIAIRNRGTYYCPKCQKK